MMENRWMRVFKVSGNLKALASVATKLSGRIRNYSNFIGIVVGYTEGLCYMIENEKAYRDI